MAQIEKSLEPKAPYKPFPGMWNAFRARDFVLKLGLRPYNYKRDIATLASFMNIEPDVFLLTMHPLTYARDIMKLPEFSQRALLGREDYEALSK